MNKDFRILMGAVLLLMLSSCAVLHHVQVGELNNDPRFELSPFEIKVSETGVDFQEAGDIAKSLSRSKTAQKQIDDIMAIIQLFQQGPRTGVPVFTESYAQNIIKNLYEECPSGQVTGVVSIREMRKYPVISGEIIKIKGFCMSPKTAAKSENKKTDGDKNGKKKKETI